MRELDVPFAEELARFGDEPSWGELRKLSPSGKVPCLVDGSQVVWDSLAITEYVAERHRNVWPADAAARAWARSAAAEMHSGFAQLRNYCSMTCGVRLRLKEFPDSLRSDIGRIEQLWSEGLRRFGGPFLAGSVFTAADAFYAPIAFRVQSYALTLSPIAMSYVQRLLALPSMQRWYADALQETFRDEPHEREILQVASVLEDIRQT